MSHSSSIKKAKSEDSASKLELVERISKVKVEVKEEPVSPPRCDVGNSNNNNNNNNDGNTNDDNVPRQRDSDVPLAVKFGLLRLPRRRGKNQDAVANTAAAAQRKKRVRKPKDSKRKLKDQRWYNKHAFSGAKSEFIDESLLPDPRVKYTEEQLKCFSSIGLAYRAGLAPTAVALSSDNRNFLQRYHVRAYIPDYHNPQEHDGTWMPVEVRYIFDDDCKNILVARLDNSPFPGRHQCRNVKLVNKLVQLIPKTDEELVGPLIHEILRKQDEQAQQQQQQRDS